MSCINPCFKGTLPRQNNKIFRGLFSPCYIAKYHTINKYYFAKKPLWGSGIEYVCKKIVWSRAKQKQYSEYTVQDCKDGSGLQFIKFIKKSKLLFLWNYHSFSRYFACLVNIISLLSSLLTNCSSYFKINYKTSKSKLLTIVIKYDILAGTDTNKKYETKSGDLIS